MQTVVPSGLCTDDPVSAEFLVDLPRVFFSVDITSFEMLGPGPKHPVLSTSKAETI